MAERKNTAFDRRWSSGVVKKVASCKVTTTGTPARRGIV
jgi:hypothetical protein